MSRQPVVLLVLPAGCADEGHIWTLWQYGDWLLNTVYGKEGGLKEEEQGIPGKQGLYMEGLGFSFKGFCLGH